MLGSLTGGISGVSRDGGPVGPMTIDPPGGIPLDGHVGRAGAIPGASGMSRDVRGGIPRCGRVGWGDTAGGASSATVLGVGGEASDGNVI